MKLNSIAIDGPAGAGKSTIARKVAGQLGFIYVDTGAMYRAMALFMEQNHIDPSDQDAVSRACRRADISIAYQDGGQVTLLDGVNVNAMIRTEQISQMASVFSANGDVRRRLVELQQKLAQETPVVMDGRDIGTVVLPDAVCKIYLTASVRVRAERRLKEAGLNVAQMCHTQTDIGAAGPNVLNRENARSGISPADGVEEWNLLLQEMPASASASRRQ